MSDKKISPKKVVSPTIITLTLPEEDSPERSGTLVIQRGELAHVRQFTYTGVSDMTAVIKAAYIALSAIEAEPPKEGSKPVSSGKSSQPEQTEPTIEIPLKKGSVEVKVSYLKIIGGETDAAAYRQAVLIAGKLLDGKLWDGSTPIQFDDVYAVQRKIMHLSERELSLFALSDFVKTGAVAETSSEDQAPGEQEAELPILNSSTTLDAVDPRPDDEAIQSTLI